MISPNWTFDGWPLFLRSASIAGIPIIEHMTNLEQLPARGFTFTVVPPKITGAGTFTVRAYATLSER